jgi:flavin-dependent dehydrogenase
VTACDVLVVGGGPAGSSCAKRLVEAGLEVQILDRAAFPRDKACAGWITPGVLETLGIPAQEYGQGRTLQAFTGFRTGRIGGPGVETRYSQPVSFGIRRREFDAHLIERSGAQVRTGATVTTLRREGDTWIVNEEVRAPLVVGAGGHFCPVGRFLNGPPRPDDGLVSAQEVEFRLDAAQQAACPVRPEVPELYFCRDLRGYGWCVRKADYLNLGLGRRDALRLPDHLREFVAFLVGLRRIPADLPSRWPGHAYRLYEPTQRRVVGEGLLLVGDSAGLAERTSGEGIRAAVESGLLAADAILASRGRYRREDLSPYEAALVARLGPRRRTVSWPPGLANMLGRLVLGSAWFARELVLERWFLKPGRGLLGEGTRLDPARHGGPSGAEVPASPVASSVRSR